MRLTQLLHKAVQQDPNRLATIFGNRSRSVAESVDRIARLAAALRDLGVAKDDRVAIAALNSDRYHEILLAVPWAGGVVVPVNVRWSAAEIAYSLRDCGCRVLLVDDTFLAMVPTLQSLAPGVDVVIHAREASGVTSSGGQQDAIDPDAPSGNEIHDYETLVGGNTPCEDAQRGGGELFGVFYTGGTTGDPKGVMLSYDNVLASAAGSVITHNLLQRRGRLLHAAPMFHLADLAAWCMGLLLGSTHVMVPAFNPVLVARAIAQHGVTDVLLVPTMLQMLADSPETSDEDLSSLQTVIYGGSPISQAVLGRVRQRLPQVELTQAYGMTELSPIATLLLPQDHDDERLTRSAGRAAAHAEVRVVDVDDREVAAGIVGEVVVRGDSVMHGYWNRPEESARALRGGWMHTGDGGYLDSSGYLFVVDRIKDMIITGGENVYSVEVENALAKHPAVQACAVIGVPDPQWGERVHAVVVLHAGAAVADLELRDFCRHHIANYKLPRSFDFVPRLPISGAGKVLKRELRADLSSSVQPAGSV